MHRKRPYLVFSTILLYVVVALAGYAQAAPVQLTWDAATHNTDGTPLTDLAGYRIYYWQPEWEFPERVEVGTETSRTLTGLEVGKTYHFAVTAFNTEQRESVYSKDISVTIPVPASPPVADFSASPLEGVAPFTVTFTDTSTGDITGWLWDFADGIGSTLQHPTHTFMAAGTYTVSLTVTGPGGTDTITKGNVVTVTASDLKHLPVASVQASADDGNVPAHTLDGDPTTRWSAMGDGQWIEYDLGSVHSVGEVAIAWYKGDQRVAFFDLEVSSDGTTWTPVFSGQSSGTTLEPELFTFDPVEARYVRYVGFGNSSSAWNSVTDIGIWTP